MGRHKNPRYNRKRLVVAGTAAVTVFGAMVGVGIYGSALADQPAPAAASRQCLPDPAPTTPPVTTTTAATESSVPSEPVPSETVPSETLPSDTVPSETAPSETLPSETAPSETAPSETAPDTGGTGEPSAPALAGGGLVALNGAAQPSGTGEPAPNDAPARDYGGPRPADQPGQAPADAQVRRFGAPDCTDQLGPFPADFVDIRRVRPANTDVRARRGGATGTFVSRCGRNEGGHHNSANFIVAPGNPNGAQHTHDYVGNDSTDGFSTNESLAAAGTTCALDDRSAYFWPVIRVRERGAQADEVNAHNVGTVQRPTSVTLQFRGNARAKVVPMPRFLRVLTGDAKSSTNGGANANAKWTCTGFTNRVTQKYPLCPRGSQLVRIADFPGCWDGQNTDSANHRTHVSFADRNGACPAGTRPIPQLRITLTYDLPRGKVFAVDSFPAEKHNPITDHNDFVNVMPESLMNRVVRCVNTGRRC